MSRPALEYRVKTDPLWIAAIDAGDKTADGLLAAGIVASIKPGDTICYFTEHDSRHVLITEAPVFYRSYYTLLWYEGLPTITPGMTTIWQAANDLRKYDSLWDELNYGVLLVRFRPL